MKIVSVAVSLAFSQALFCAGVLQPPHASADLEHEFDEIIGEENVFRQATIFPPKILTHSLMAEEEQSVYHRPTNTDKRQKRGTCGEPSVFTPTQKEEAIRAHNTYRAKELSSEMKQVVWNEDLANQAQAWANECSWRHSMLTDCEGKDVGQNMYYESSSQKLPPINATKAVYDWYAEIAFYEFKNNTCLPNQICGHYTQLVWAKTSEVGCGAAYCDPASEGLNNLNPYKYVLLLVCDYRPGGNIIGQHPYKLGSACSNCERHGQLMGYECENGLCVNCNESVNKDCTCIPRQCLNNGTWDSNTCTCRCTIDYFGQDCEEPCKCEDKLTSRICAQISQECNNPDYRESMLEDCRKTCNLCKTPPTGACTAEQDNGINECDEPDICGDHGQCVNTPSSYTCSCESGYFARNGICEDVNECKRGWPCGPNGQCINYGGGYRCECNDGYEEHNGQCQSVNECEDLTLCGSHGQCVDTQDGYKCVCDTGYSEKDGICQDVDECEDTTLCGKHQTCANLQGTYECVCVSGFTKENDICVDVNECEDTTLCGEHQTCANLEGTYECVCVPGFTKENGICVETCTCEDDEVFKPACKHFSKYCNKKKFARLVRKFCTKTCKRCQIC